MEKLAFMRRAIALSAEPRPHPGDEPFAAVIVKEGAIVGEGRNSMGSQFDPTAHGEIVAIRDACRRLQTTDLAGCELYTSCEPCSLCVAAIWWSNIERVYYACTLADAHQLGFCSVDALAHEVGLPIHRRARPSERLLAEEATAVLREWIGNQRLTRSS